MTRSSLNAGDVPALVTLRTTLLYTAAALLAASHSAPAIAAGTVAGTDIQNVASATYDVGSGPVTIQSNTVIIKIDELLAVTVTSTDPGDIITSPGATSNIQTFQITNNGNGNEVFALTANVANGGDDFDPVLTQIVIDTNDNGIYDPGVDDIYVTGSSNPNLDLAPDQQQIVFVITSTPAAVSDTNRADVNLSAVASTGTGAPGTSFVGAGQGGGNAVVGPARPNHPGVGAIDTANGFLAVQAASVTLLKSATILDPFGGNRPVPGAIITYSLVATVSGSGTLNNLNIVDPIPVGTQYQTETISLETSALTDDATDADAGNYDGTRISVAAGNVPAGQTRTVTFKVLIP
jgi:uncharacterized repeat protein (TIGR01451 family)